MLNDSNIYVHLKNFCKQNIGLQKHFFLYYYCLFSEHKLPVKKSDFLKE